MRSGNSGRPRESMLGSGLFGPRGSGMLPANSRPAHQRCGDQGLGTQPCRAKHRLSDLAPSHLPARWEQVLAGSRGHLELGAADPEFLRGDRRRHSAGGDRASSARRGSACIGSKATSWEFVDPFDEPLEPVRLGWRMTSWRWRARPSAPRPRRAGGHLEERARIARELHDVVAHHLSLIAGAGRGRAVPAGRRRPYGVRRTRRDRPLRVPPDSACSTSRPRGDHRNRSPPGITCSHSCICC